MTEIDSFAELIRSEGWGRLSKWIHDATQAALDSAVKSNDPYITAKHLGVVQALRSVNAYPSQIIQALQQASAETDIMQHGVADRNGRKGAT